MKEFDRFELDPNNNRILACCIDGYKIPIFRLSSIATDQHRVIVYDNDQQMYVLETGGKDLALQKLQELTAFVKKHFKLSPSCFMP